MKRALSAFAAAVGLAAIWLPAAHAQELVRIPPDQSETGQAEADQVVVVGRASDILGVATSSSEGVVSAADLATRPIFRPGEIMETIPGVIVTQHSGSGKANQYFMRGFNLDHGTDLATDFEGMPINMPSNAHGQGYTDLNFIIPELVSEVDYKKGNYFASVGDFGSAGAFSIHYFDVLPGSFLKVEGGDIGFERLVFAMAPAVGPGHLLCAFEMEHNDGPWDHPDAYQKLNGVVRYSVGDGLNGGSLTALVYHGIWNSSDQVPDRAITEGIIDRFGEIDPTDGGSSSRYSLTGEWHRGTENEQTRVVAYATEYELDLFSDFTYFLVDPIHGDQFEQKDQRMQIGGSASETWTWKFLGIEMQNTVGLQERSDFIHLGLYHTEAQVVLGDTRLDHVIETRVGPYVENKTQWLPWLRTVAGFRADVFAYHDTDYTDHISGDGDAAIVSPKFSLILGPWASTEIYLNGGYGFHSNDIRAVVGPPIPGNDAPRGSVSPLVKSEGAEIGVRTSVVPSLQSTLTLWILDLDSELVFDGDAATNEPSGPSQRWGIEAANYYTPQPWLTLDLDFAYSNARFTDHEAAGPWVPEAIQTTLDAGIAFHDLGNGWTKSLYGGLRLRFFGPRNLTQDASEKSGATTLVYLQLGYHINKTWEVTFDIFNLLNAKDADIDYYYVSRLPGEPAAGVADIHTHPTEPRELRGGVTAHF
jgi:hypothetical protein